MTEKDKPKEKPEEAVSIKQAEESSKAIEKAPENPAKSGNTEKPAEAAQKPDTPAPQNTEAPRITQTGKKAPKEIIDFIRLAREGAKPRKFAQSWDLSINLKGMNLKRPENRFNTEFMLPEGRGKEPKVAFFADSLASKATAADIVIKKADIEPLAKDKKRLKKIVRGYDWFFGEATLMVQIGKSLGAVLATRGKMPKPIPPSIDPNPLMLSAKKNVRVQVKESPVVHVAIGSDKMEDSQIARNLDAVYEFVKGKLPKGRANIKSIYVKLTMGPSVKVVMK